MFDVILVAVAVIPVYEALEEEEKDEAKGKVDVYYVILYKLDSLWKEVEVDGAQDGTGREADYDEDDSVEGFLTES